MQDYTYQNTLIGKKQLRQLLAWSFTNYDSMQACSLADELKYLGFRYASQAGISISIEDLRVPFVKSLMLEKANQEILNSEKIYLKGKITEVERFQKIIDTWSLTSESLKEQVIYYFKNYDPLNSVYIMAFSGARGNVSQVRQLVGMRGLMSDPSGQIMNLPIKKNFREGLTITDYLMSGYGARKGIVDTALKTANSGYLTRRLIDIGQDILIREKDCGTTQSFLLTIKDKHDSKLIHEKILGRVLSKSIVDEETKQIIAHSNTQITPKLLEICKEKNISKFYIRSPLTCNLYRAICQKCYGWDLASENIVDIGEAVGILAGQSIGEPGTQLTMRTFHTGGIFTSEARQQILSPANGIIRFYKMLKTVLLRTTRGEDVLITKNSGSIILVPTDKTKELQKIEVLRNTILFPKNNQYITKDAVIGELINTNKQIKTEIKPILSDSCGEIFIPRLKKKVNLINNNKLIWILSGQLYNSPKNSFINFYPDYKLNPYSYIFRTKIVSQYKSFITFLNNKKDLYQKLVKISKVKYSFKNSTFKRFTPGTNSNNYLLELEDQKYLIQLQKINSRAYLQLSLNNNLGTLITNTFRTLTGGTLYYDYPKLLKYETKNKIIPYLNRDIPSLRYKPIVSYRTLMWLGEEIHEVDCEPNILLVENGDFISEKFEIIPGLFSKTSGIVSIQQKNNIVQTISIQSGLVYEGKNFKNASKKIYYPGELIYPNVPIKYLSFCEQRVGKNAEQLIVRPIEIYEFSHSDSNCKLLTKYRDCIFQPRISCSYKPNQTIKGVQNINLISSFLNLKSESFSNPNIDIELFRNKKTKSINLQIDEKVSLNNYLVPQLQYKNIQSSLLIQPNQFIDQYSILGYLEAITSTSLEIVKAKTKTKDVKQILLISNEDCVTVKKEQLPNKKINDFVINPVDSNIKGKIIIENNHLLTLQKGRPYFFPNCKNDNSINKSKLQYKTISLNRFANKIQTNRLITLNYRNLMKFSVTQKYKFEDISKGSIAIKADFSKLFLKKNGKFYSSLMPQFFKKFSISNSSINRKYKQLLRPNSENFLTYGRNNKTLLLQSSGFSKNQYKSLTKSDLKLVLVKFMEHPFIKASKSVGLYSITEDYFEQDVNNVFCNNSEFIETGETIGLLNLEKEITGDIVQGLPRIEEILEARKKNLIIKKLPTSQKKGLLVQKTSLDQNFEFRKLGTTVKENDKINPHKLLKVYFNYYGLTKFFTCDRTKKVHFNRLIQNYEGSYKTFKKVQLFILNSVQSVYQSQGVTINDKHLEVIIKQMTTKVLITFEGSTPLLRREVIDLYHIQYINQVMESQSKQPAYYVPLLLGITKAALNNPSFISAASFQETTRVLTKAAIEGRIDWLRGLKENIIIGHLIPAGTGSPNYKNCFKEKKKLSFEPTILEKLEPTMSNSF